MRHNDVETNGLWRFSPKTIILTSAGPPNDNFHLLREITLPETGQTEPAASQSGEL